MIYRQPRSFITLWISCYCWGCSLNGSFTRMYKNRQNFLYYLNVCSTTAMHFSLTRMHYKFNTMVRFWSFWVTVGIAWNRHKLFFLWPETFCFCAWTWRSYVCPSKRGRVALSSFTECFNCQLYTVASHYFLSRFFITTGLVDIL